MLPYPPAVVILDFLRKLRLVFLGLDEDYNSYYYGAYAFELAMFWDLLRLSRVAATCEIGTFPC